MTLSKVKCFLLDMDGTFYLGGRIIPGSLEFIRALENTGRSYLFLTNNSSHNAQFYQKRLEGMGLSVPLERILTSGSATAALIRERYAGKRAFVLGNEYLLAEFEEAGVPIDQQNPDLVVIGYDTTLDYKKMTAVCDFVRAGCLMWRRTRISIVPRKRASLRISAPSWPLSRPARAAGRN